MQRSRVCSRLKAQLTKFTSELREGLRKPVREFVGEMMFGIQASQDVKLSNIERSLDEPIPLIKTEDRLSRNLKAKELEDHPSEKLVIISRRFFGIPPFRFYALADGIKQILAQGGPSPRPEHPPNLPRELLLAWES